MIDFKNPYNREEVLEFLQNSFLEDFQKDIRTVDIPEQKHIQEAFSLGYSRELELYVFEFLHKGSTEKRVTLTKEAFNVLRDSGTFKAIGIFYSKDTNDWRFSLMTATPVVNEKSQVKTILSNPKRYSFLLGPNAKVHTPTKFLITKGVIQDFEDLKERFSIEVVNKEFYKYISAFFTALSGAEDVIMSREIKRLVSELTEVEFIKVEKGIRHYKVKNLMKLPGEINEKKYQEFVVRLLGRIIFCWFLREKKDGSTESLMPESLLSLNASVQINDYYHSVLEPIFFEVLNVPLLERKEERYKTNPFDKIPYLNGGLFSPSDDDFYLINSEKQEKQKKEVVVPDIWVRRLFEVLETYNFTIDENSTMDEELSIDPEMLGRIFENLLAEINPETGESARKKTGSYYTPRPIVDYMVDEVLYLYLQKQTQIEDSKLKALISYDLEDDLEYPISESEGEKIIEVLEKLTILDPACGSGAFPIGALQKIVFILQRLDPRGEKWYEMQTRGVSPELKKEWEEEHKEKNYDFLRKLGIIRKNIFGVDIQPIAVEISRLRCFLTLIVDQKINDTEKNRGIKALPNLDFKFVAANTLISLPVANEKVKTMELFEDKGGIEKLKEVRKDFFNATEYERNNLRLQFKDIQLEMAKYYSSVRGASPNLTKRLLEWNPFSHKCTDWFDADWMFGVKDGFDIVIGNPPYVQLQKNSGELGNLYKDYGFETFERTGDIYCLFYEKAYNLLSNEGYFAYITSNKWMRAGYGRKLRKFLSNNFSPKILLDLGPGVFEDVTVDTNILIARKGYTADSSTLAFTVGKDIKNIDIALKDYVEKEAYNIKSFSEDGWIILSPIEQSIKEKIERYGTPLKDWDIKIYRGILTGCNEAFIIDGKKRDELIKQDPKSAEIIRPILRGRDIKKFSYDFADLYLINTHNGIEQKGIPPVKIDDYPAVKKHLDTYYSKLKERDDKGITPYNLRSCAYMEEFNKPKIVYSEIVQSPQFFLDKEGMFFVEATSFLITGEHLDYLVDWLNSPIIAWIFKQFYAGGGLGKKGFRYKKNFLERLPIPKPKNDMKYEGTNDLIKTYLGLTDEETNFISSSVNL